MPSVPSAISTAKPPATHAPTNGIYAATKLTTAIDPASGTPSTRAAPPIIKPLKAAMIVTPRK